MEIRIWEDFKELYKEDKLKKNTTIIAAGEVSKKIFYIEKGCVRVWYNNNGKEVTFQFYFENQFISLIESFWNNQPSLYTLEAIEQSSIHSITKQNFDIIINRYPEIEKEFQNLIFKRLLHYQKLFLSTITDTPEKRYIELLQNNQQILKRIPQHYIASYLGITSVSLSRIRNRR